MDRTRLVNCFGVACVAVGFLGAALILANSFVVEKTPQLDLDRVTLSAGISAINAQVAATSAQRSIGLMHRKVMPSGDGMLFVFENVAQRCFWMKNTVLALSVAFVADDGTVVNLADMKPLTTDLHCSTQPVRYVLEMNMGWFSKEGIKAGFKLTGQPFFSRR